MHTPEITFLCGAVLTFLLFYYLGTTVHRTKKIIGTVLTIGISAFCLWAFMGIGIKKGIDLGGGSSYTVMLKPGKNEDGTVKEVDASSVQQAIAILEKRLNPNGENDLAMAPLGKDRISIQMPGIEKEKVDDVRKKIQQVAHLEFRLVHPQSEARLAEIKTQGGIEPGYVEMPSTEDRSEPGTAFSYLVKSRTDLEGKYVSKAYAYPDPMQGWMIGLEFNSEGAKRFGTLTAANVNQRLAIVVDGHVLSAPVLRDAITGGHAQITGKFKEEEARGLSTALQNPLENPMEIIEESFVTADFGDRTVQQGIKTGVVSTVLVALFMLIYYRFAGLIALIGLTVCMLTVFGAMALFNFTLTMPGIAGIVLTIGMAVDANVLIYERLREEMAAGKTLAAALESAFEKAFSAIFDANITSLFSAVILFYLASSLVKGFAVTLTVGIVGTLLGALIVTRVCFNWFIDSGKLTKITVTRIIPEGTYDLLKWSKHFTIGSFVLAALCLVMFAVKGKDSLGIDFRGGAVTKFALVGNEKIGAPVIEDTLKKAGLQGFYVQEGKTDTNETLTVRSEYEDREKVKSVLEKEYAGKLSNGQTEGIGSMVGKELAVRSTIAYLLAVLAIFVYLVIFYEFSFALAAIVALIHDCILAIGFSVLLGQQLSVIHIGALLTVAGYSLNDTIIVFDRIRDMLKTHSGNLRDLMNEAISATLSRTLLTSLTVLMSMIVLYLFGGTAMQEFALPIIIGVVVGTYSSIYIASALVLYYVQFTGKSLHHVATDTAVTEVKPVGA